MIFDIGKGLGAGPEAKFSTGFIGITYDFHGFDRFTVRIFLLVDFTVAVDGQFQFLRQGVDNRYTDTV